MMAARAAILLPPFAKATMDWVRRCPKADGMGTLQIVNSLLVRGASNTNWLGALGELLIMATGRPESSLTGIKGLVNYSNAEFLGSPVFVPLHGWQRSQSDTAQIETFIRFPLKPYDVPGLTDYNLAMGLYIFSNFLGNFVESGSGGSGGNTALGMRASAGFRPTFSLGSPPLLYGGAANWGFHFGYRSDDQQATMWREATKLVVASVITGTHLANNKFTMLSIEPSGPYNTPNGHSFWFVGNGSPWTDDMVLQMRSDLTQYLIDLDVYDDIAVPPIVPGPNCFPPAAIATTAPGMRVFQQIRFPASNTTPATSYSRYPITDSVTGCYLTGSMIVTNPAPPAAQTFTDPITTTAGSNLAWLTAPVLNSPLHALCGEYGMDNIAFTGGNGLAPEDINGRRLIVAGDSPNGRVQFTLGRAATASGAIGGTAGQTRFQFFRPSGPDPTLPLSQQFIPPRGGRLGQFIPIFRSNGQDVLDAGASHNPKGSANSPPMTRTTALGSLQANAPCIMLYSSWEQSIYAMLTFCAHNAGYAKRNEPRDPLGQGWMDIAEQGGFTEDKVQTWKYFYANADTLFTEPSGILAGCRDMINLLPVTLADVAYDPSQKAQWFDCEHQDRIPYDLNEFRYQRWNDICKATGIKWWNYGHFMVDPQAYGNGFSLANSTRIISLSECDGFCLSVIPVYRQGAEDMIAFLDRQYRFCCGPNGDQPPPADHFMIRGNFGGGKFNIEDPGPLGQNQTSLADCDRLAQWMIDHGMKKFGVGQGSASMGGPINRYWNQQFIHFLPGLDPQVPPVTADPALITDGWIDIVTALGGTVSDDFRLKLMSYVDALINQQIWPKLLYLCLPCAESVPGMQVDVCSRVVGTLPTGSPLPNLVPLQGWDMDGVDDQFDTGFIPATMHNYVIAADQVMVGICQRIPRSEATAGQIMGTIDTAVTTTDGTWRFIPRTASQHGFQLTLGTTQVDPAIGDTDAPWDGMLIGQRSGSDTQIYRNGELVAEGSNNPPLAASVIPNRSVQVGCGRNVAGAPANFRACNPQLIFIGAPLTPTEALTFSALSSNFLVSIGAAASVPDAARAHANIHSGE